ncbi:MAG: nucleotidyltransferase domain-containing protein [Thermoproteales archaeon]|nr:nucleotidyltransferase domain-containing protein [Thermoproteales archaeon]RLE65946.1 MAG: nucleotidyltransferase domain-containing protein [Thermoprotei archaeon]
MEELRRAVDRLRSKYNVHAVILFGSRARGDWTPWSDYDLLILADFKEKYLDRIGVILGLLSDIKLPIEPHPYTLKEAIQMLKKGNPMIVDAIEEGKILFHTKRLTKIVKIYNTLKRKGLTKTKTSIKLP